MYRESEIPDDGICTFLHKYLSVNTYNLGFQGSIKLVE